MVLGFGAGVGMIIATETLDRSFRDVDETVDQPKLPVFGAVSEIVTHTEAHRRRVMAWGVFPALGVAARSLKDGDGQQSEPIQG